MSERRHRDRIETNLPVTCRIPALPTAARILDLSKGGCKLEVTKGQLELGGTITFDLAGGARCKGMVMWVRNNTAGVKFLPTLSGRSAVALGLEEPEPIEIVEAVPEAAKNRGILHHWIRLFSRKAA